MVDDSDDSRRMVRATDRQYPSNARRTRPWVWALALPVLVVVALGGVFLYQRIFGAPAVDPLNLNSRARDAVILLPVPDGWTRSDVVTACPGEPDGCAGGGFLKVGTTSTTWFSPVVAKGTSVGDAAEAACQDLSAQLLARSSAPSLRVADCVPFLEARLDPQFNAKPVLTWTDTDGAWMVRPVPRSDLPAGTGPKQFGFAVAYVPKS